MALPESTDNKEKGNEMEGISGTKIVFILRTISACLYVIAFIVPTTNEQRTVHSFTQTHTTMRKMIRYKDLDGPWFR
jgi:hypothetical protein